MFFICKVKTGKIPLTICCCEVVVIRSSLSVSSDRVHLFVFSPSYHLWYLQVYNKVDQISIEEVDRLARRPNSAVIRSDIRIYL